MIDPIPKSWKNEIATKTQRHQGSQRHYFQYPIFVQLCAFEPWWQKHTFCSELIDFIIKCWDN
jgi:hypothetical protein